MALRRRAAELVRRFPVEIDIDRTPGSMASVDREAVAILRALARDDIAVLILDEPTSILMLNGFTLLSVPYYDSDAIISVVLISAISMFDPRFTAGLRRLRPAGSQQGAR